MEQAQGVGQVEEEVSIEGILWPLGVSLDLVSGEKIKRRMDSCTNVPYERSSRNPVSCHLLSQEELTLNTRQAQNAILFFLPLGIACLSLSCLVLSLDS